MGELHRARNAAFLIFDENEAAAWFQRRRGTSHMNGRLGLPSGKLKKGEVPTDTAVREAREGCGVVIHPSALELVHMQYNSVEGSYDWVNWYFRVLGYKGTLRIAEPDKVSEFRLESFRALPQDVIPYVQRALHEYCRNTENVTFSEFHF